MLNMTFEYRQLTTEDSDYFSEALELLNRTQGRDLFDSDYLNLRTSDPKSYVVAAFSDQKLVALGVAQLIDSFEYYLDFDSEIVEELKDKKVGSFSTLCVLESLQSKGVGQALSKYRLDWIKKHNCEVILGISWVSGLKNTSDRVFSKMGFNPVKKVEKFFYQSSLEKPFECPGCGSPPCECGAILFRLDLF